MEIKAVVIDDELLGRQSVSKALIDIDENVNIVGDANSSASNKSDSTSSTATNGSALTVATAASYSSKVELSGASTIE